MKKYIALFMLVVSVALAQQPTPNIGLQIPPTGSNNWYIPLNYNFSKLDQLLSGNLKLPALSVGTITADSYLGPSGSGFATAVSSPQYSPAYFNTSGGGTSLAGATPFTGLAYYAVNAAPRAASVANILSLWSGCTGSTAFMKFDGTCAAGGGGGTPSGTPLRIAGFLSGSGSTNLTSFNFSTDSSYSDLLGVRYLTANKSINDVLNYDGYGSFANIAASTDCTTGCVVDVAPNSTIGESPYTFYTLGINSSVLHYNAGGSKIDSYNNPNNGPNSVRSGAYEQCNFANSLEPNQVTICHGIVDTSSAPGTYQGSPWQVHDSLPITSYTTGRAIHQTVSLQNYAHTGGDSGNLYSYMFARCALIATSDEGCLHASLQTFEDVPPAGVIVTGGQSATVVKSNFTVNSNNEADYMSLVSLDPSDVAATGLMLSQSLDTVTHTEHIVTSDTHAASTAIGVLATACGESGLSRNAPVTVSCLVTNYSTYPHAWAVGPQSACIADTSYYEQVFISAIGTGAAWQASHNYGAGDWFYDGANYQEVTVPGTSGATAPTFATVVGNDTTDNTATYTVIALGSNSTTLTVDAAYAHADGIYIGQGGMCGHARVDGAGTSTPLAPAPWTAEPMVFSLDTTSFNYVAPYTGGQQGVAAIPIPSFVGQGWINYSRVGNTVTAYVEGGTANWNGFVPPSGTTVVVNTGNSNFDSATSFSNFSMTTAVNPNNSLQSLMMTYNDNLSATDGGGSGGSITLNGYNNYVAPCAAETVQVLNTTPRGANQDSGSPGGDGTLMLEPNSCLWPVGGSVEQPNSFNSGYGGMRIATNIITPPMVNGNQMLKLGLNGTGNSMVPFISMNDEGVDDLGTMFGYGGTNLGHVAIHSQDWFHGYFDFFYSPLNGGIAFNIGNRPPGTAQHVYTFLSSTTDVGDTTLQVDQETGDMNFSGAGSGAFNTTYLGALDSQIYVNLLNVLGYTNDAIHFNNEFGYLSINNAGRQTNAALSSDATVSTGYLYASTFYAGAIAPASQGLFPTGPGGSSTWCYAAVPLTSVGHGVSTGNVCTAIGPTAYDPVTSQLFVKFWQQPGTQSLRIFRTASPNNTTFPLGVICDNVPVSNQGCNDIGQGVTNTDDPSTYIDTSGTFYSAAVNGLNASFNSSLKVGASVTAASDAIAVFKGSVGASHTAELQSPVGATRTAFSYVSNNTGTPAAIWEMGTDYLQNGTANFYWFNYATGRPSMLINTDDSISFFAKVSAAAYHETLFTPSSSTAACNAGDFADDAAYHYVCTAANTWMRVALLPF